MKKVVAATILWLMVIVILQIPVYAQIAPLANDIAKARSEVLVVEDVDAAWLSTEVMPLNNPMKVYGVFDGNELLCEVPSVFNDIIMFCLGKKIPTVVSLVLIHNEFGDHRVTLKSISIPL